MTNLTEHGKPQLYGYYYVEFYNGKQGIKQFGEFANTWTPKKTFCEVPSYELWKAVLEQWQVLRKENTKLKVVLKRCREFVDDFPTDNDEDWVYKNAVLNGIDELLGEE